MKDQGGATLFKCSACKSDYHHLCAVTGTGGGGNREELGKVLGKELGKVLPGGHCARSLSSLALTSVMCCCAQGTG